MTYLKVVKPITVLEEVKGWKGHYKVVISLVKGELLTEREAEKNRVPERAVEKVELPRSRVYKLFGCRFDMQDMENPVNLGGRK